MTKIANVFARGKLNVSAQLTVFKAIVEYVDSKYIKLLLNDNEIFESAELFYAKNGFPKCIETVDGTHIPLKKPRTGYQIILTARDIILLILKQCLILNTALLKFS